MKYQIISQLVNGEEIPVSARGFEDLEIEDYNTIAYFADNKNSRMIAFVQKGKVFRLTKNSYAQLKRDLAKKGVLSRFDYSRKMSF